MTTKKSRDCGCRCGGTTAGGKFLPGHDAKIVPQLEEDHGSILQFWAWYEQAIKDKPPIPGQAI